MDLITAFLVTALTAALLQLWWRRGRRGHLPPGPWGVPLLGNLPFLRPDLARHFADLAAVHGPILSLHLGPKLFLVVSSPSAAAEVHGNIVFANHGQIEASKAFFTCPDIAFQPHGPIWRMLRQIAVRELLSPTAIESFRQLRREQMARVLEGIRASAGRAVEIRGFTYSYAIGVIMGMIWDEALVEGEMQAMAAELREVVENVIRVLSSTNVSDFLPWLAPLDQQGLRRKIGGLAERYSAVFRSMVEQKTGRRGGDGAKSGGSRDFLQLLLDLVGEGEAGGPVLEPQHMRSLVFDIIGGGTDTTSTTVEWALAELVRKPSIMARLAEELDAVVGRNSILEEAHLPELHYLDAVVKETLRLDPIFPISVPRSASADCELGGYAIPRDTGVFINVWAIQRDPSIWDRPQEFRPERFLEHKDRWGYKRMGCGFMPFGGGRRICAGLNLAERMVKYMVGSLVHSFDWKLPPGEETIDMAPEPGFMLKKKKPLELVPYLKN